LPRLEEKLKVELQFKKENWDLSCNFHKIELIS
jgi:hypothetical protein